MKTKPLTEKEVQERLPKELLKKLKAEFEAPILKAFTAVAIAAAPEDAGRAAVRLIQVCGRVPKADEVAAIFARQEATPEATPTPEPEPLVVNPVTPVNPVA